MALTTESVLRYLYDVHANALRLISRGKIETPIEIKRLKEVQSQHVKREINDQLDKLW